MTAQQDVDEEAGAESVTRGVEQHELAAELATIESLLADMPASCVLERRGLEGRSARLRARLAEIHAPAGRNAEVARLRALITGVVVSIGETDDGCPGIVIRCSEETCREAAELLGRRVQISIGDAG